MLGLHRLLLFFSATVASVKMNRGCHQPNHCRFQPPQNFGGRGLPPGAGRPRLPQQRHPSFPGRGQFCGPPPRGGRFPGACIPSPRLGPRNDRGRSRPPGPGSLPNQRPPGPGSSPHQRPPVPGSLPHQRPLGPGSSPRQRPPGPGSSPHQRPPGPSPHQRPPGPGSSPHQRPPGPGSSPHQRPPGPGSSPRQRPPGPGLSPHQRPNFCPQQLMQLPPGPTNQTVGFHQGQRPHWRGPPGVRPGGPRPDAGNFRFRGQVPFSGRPARPYYDGTSNMGQKRQHPGGDGDGKKVKSVSILYCQMNFLCKIISDIMLQLLSFVNMIYIFYNLIQFIIKYYFLFRNVNYCSNVV